MRRGQALAGPWWVRAEFVPSLFRARGGFVPDPCRTRAEFVVVAGETDFRIGATRGSMAWPV